MADKLYRWADRGEKPDQEKETFECLIMKKENGEISVRPEYVEWFFGNWQFPIGHEKGWFVYKWLKEVTPPPPPESLEKLEEELKKEHWFINSITKTMWESIKEKIASMMQERDEKFQVLLESTLNGEKIKELQSQLEELKNQHK